MGVRVGWENVVIEPGQGNQTKCGHYSGKVPGWSGIAQQAPLSNFCEYYAMHTNYGAELVK